MRRDAQGLSANSVQLYPYVVEGIMDFFKGKGAAAPAGGGVNADALNKAWAAAGSPTDSEEVAKILQSAGVDPAVISKTYTDMSLPEPAGKIEPTLDDPSTGSVNTKDMMDMILKLNPDEQKQVLAYLKR